MSKKNILSISINGATGATTSAFTSKESAVKFLMSQGLVRSVSRRLTNAGVVAPQTHVNGTNTFKIEPAIPDAINLSVNARGATRVASTIDEAAFQPVSKEAEVPKAAAIPVSPYPFPMGRAPL